MCVGVGVCGCVWVPQHPGSLCVWVCVGVCGGVWVGVGVPALWADVGVCGCGWVWVGVGVPAPWVAAPAPRPGTASGHSHLPTAPG